MTMNPLLARFANEPALLEPSATERFRMCLAAVCENEHAAEMMADQATVRASDDDFWSQDSWRATYRPYVVRNGVLQIPVGGVLLHNFPYALGSFATGYDYIQRAFERGQMDDNVRAIAFIVDSPGGMVAGCFDAVDKMVAMKSDKPVRAFAHESAYSAAYAIAGGVADHIAVSRTGGVGSIGVVTMHIDVSKALEKQGVTVTYIHAGKHKVDGNPYEPLPDDVRERIQARIDESYQVFVSAVARGRGMEEKDVRATEALCFTATQATSNGLADSIGTLDDAMAAFVAFLDDQSDNTGEDAMADEATQSAVDQAALDAARAEGVTAGATAERERISAILGSDEAKDRGKLALHLAMNTGMSPDDARSTLAAAQVEVAAVPEPKKDEAKGKTFEDAMANGNPEVGGAPTVETDEAATEDGSDIVALAKKAGLAGFAQR